jgi:hypothetical protein
MRARREPVRGAEGRPRTLPGGVTTPGGIGKLLMIVVAGVAPCSALLGQRTDAARIDLGVSLSIGSQVDRLGAALLGGVRLPVSSAVTWRPAALLMVTTGTAQTVLSFPEHTILSG